MTKEGDLAHGSFFLLVDGERYAEKEGYYGEENGAPATSATITVQLSAGQLVSVQNVGSLLVYGTYARTYIQSWFTGHLLYAL